MDKRPFPLRTQDLAGVVYSSGKVFDGLRTSRLDTQSFLESGDTHGIASRADLALLQDLRDAVKVVIAFRDTAENQTSSPVLTEPAAPPQMNGDLVCAINRAMSRSAALRPGELRRDDQSIGVATRYGEHRPPSLQPAQLDDLVKECVETRSSAPEVALELFVRLAEAQPFEDGNKRTALLVANAWLLRCGTGTVLQVPVDEYDASVADRFNDLLARAYVFGEHEPVKTYMAQRGIVSLHRSPSADRRARDIRSDIARRAAALDAVVDERAALDQPDLGG